MLPQSENRCTRFMRDILFAAAALFAAHGAWAQSTPDFGNATVADQFLPLGGTLGGSGNLEALTLPSATGGDAPVTYTLQPTIAGLTFDSATRVWSGTPSTAMAATTLTYTATDSDGDFDTLTYSVSVQEVTIGFERAAFLDREDVGAFQVCVEMTVPASGTALPSGGVAHVTMASAIRGTDTAEAADFTPVSTSFMFDHGNRRRCGTASITDDTVPESTENFALTLTVDESRSNFDVGLSPGTATVTIEDDDDVTLRFGASSYTVREGDRLTFAVEVSAPPSSQAIERGDFSISVSTVDGTATAGNDFTAVSSMTLGPFGDSSRSRSAQVSITDDMDPEMDETFTLQLGFTPGQPIPVGVRLPNPATATVTIRRNDSPGVTFTPSALSVQEGRSEIYAVVLDVAPNMGSVTVTPSSGDTGAATVSGALTFTTSNWNTAQTVTVTSVFDNDSDDGTVTLSHALAGSGNYASVTADNVVVTVEDVGTSALRVSGTPSVEEGQMARFQVVGEGDAPSGTVLVQCTAGPTADTADDDAEAGDFRANAGASTPQGRYPSSAILVFSSSNWSTAQNCDFFAFDDTRPEDDEKFSVTLTVLEGSPTILPSNAEGTILRGDIQVGFERTHIEVGESAGTQEVCISNEQQLEPGGSIDFGLSYSTRNSTGTGVATSGTDYVDITNAVTVSFTLTDQVQRHCFDVTIIDDATAEGMENLFIDLAPRPGETLRGISINPSQALIVITDGEITADIANAGADADPATAGFQVQAGDTAVFRVTLSAPASGLITLTYAVSEDGLSSSDYTDQTGAANNRLPFAAGVTEALVSLALNSGVSADATLTVTISNPQADGNLADAVALGTTSAAAITTASTAAVNVSPTSLVLTEGASAPYTVVLNTQPTSEVTVTPAGSDANTVSVPAAPLTFTMSNWNMAQAVTVTAVADTDNTDASASVTHTAAQSGGGDYDALAVADVEVTVRDNLMISVSELAVTEGATATYTVVLGAAPSGGNVVVTPDAGSDGAIEVSAALTFTSANWSEDQTVTVTADDDDDFADETATISHAVSGAATNYAGATAGSVVVTVDDDDTDATPYFGTGVSVPDQVFFSGAAATLQLPRAAGGDGSLTYALAGLPDNLGLTYDAAAFTLGGTPAMTLPSTMLTYSASDEDDSSAQLTFAIQVDARAQVEIGFFRASSDFVEDTRSQPAAFVRSTGSFGGGEVVVALETVIRPGDNAVPGVHFTPPANPLLRFTSATIGLVNFGIIDDNLLNVQRTFAFRMRVVSASDHLDARIGRAEGEIRILDNEFQRPLFADGGTTDPGSGNYPVSVPEGGAGTYTVRVSTGLAAGISNTIITLTDNDDDTMPSVTISPTSLTFTPDNWATPHVVTVTGLEDADMVDGSVAIAHTLRNPDATVPNTRTVQVTIVDNDVPAVLLSPTALTLREGGVSVPYTVRLQVAPTGDVTVQATTQDTVAVTLSPTALTFTTTNWDTPQTVTATAPEETGADADTTPDTGTISHTRTATGTNYASVSVPDLPVTVLDSSMPSVLFSVASLDLREGATGTVGVRLGLAPDAQTVLMPTVAPSGSLTLSSSALTFSTSNWNTAQNVIVTVTTDDDPDDSTATLTYTATNASGNYMNVGASLQVAITDTQSVPDFGDAAVANQFFPLGGTLGGGGNLQALTLPRAMSGDAPVTYTLLPQIAGLTFDAIARVLRGTPSAAMAATTLTYTATDSDSDTDSLTFSVSVQEVTIGLERTAIREREDIGAFQICAEMTVPASGTALPPGSVAHVAMRSVIRSGDTAESADFTALDMDLRFNDGNRRGCATVSITDDEVSEGTENFALTLVLDAPLSNFDVDLSPGTATVTIDDDDVINVGFGASAYTSMEGDTLTFTVMITDPPSDQAIEREDFFVSVSAVAGTAAAGSDFTAFSNTRVGPLGDSNRSWSGEVTIIDDTGEEVDETFTLQLAFVPGEPVPVNIGIGTPPRTATVTIEANDVPGVTFMPQAVSVDEGANNTYTVVLDAEPSMGNVVVTPRSGSPAATVSGALTFTPSNWDSAQTVTVTGVPDYDAADHTVTVSHAVAGSGNYASLTAGNVVATIEDDETAGVTVTPTTLALIEGASAHYVMYLHSQPAGRGSVVITPSIDNPGVATLSPADGLTFGPDDWMVAQTVTVTGIDDADDEINGAEITHTAAGADYGGVPAQAVQVTVAERVDDELQALNETILPEVTRAVVVHQLEAIAERAGLAGNLGARPGFNLNGQSSFAGVAAANAGALAGGDVDMKQMLRDMDFVMPLGAGGGSGAGGTMAFWGGSEYRDFKGEDGDTEWDGDLFSMQLGFDARVRADLLAGLMLSYNDSESEYAYVEDDETKKGEYELDMTSLNPYLNWDLPGGGAVWVTAGYGEGDLDISPDDADIMTSSSDVNMRSIGAGGSRRLLQQSRHELHVKADMFFTRTEIEGNDVNMTGLEVDASRVRVALESRHPRRLSNGMRMTPAFELGLRHDGGDGQTGAGVEVGGSLSYRDTLLGLTMEARARALLGHSGNHRGWGIGGFVRMEAGRDGQGLSLSLSPAYGNTQDNMEKLWKDGVRGQSNEDPLKARLDARLGYGVPARLRLPVEGDGMLTPYSALSWGDDKQKYRFGLRWENGRRLGLDLSARRVDEDHKDPHHALILDGKLSF